MAIPFLNNISLNNNEIQNVKLHNTGGIPSPGPGHIYFDTGDSKAKYYNGSVWVNLGEDTKYTLSAVGILPGTIGIALAGSDAIESDVELVAGNNITLTLQNTNEIKIDATIPNQTVTLEGEVTGAGTTNVAIQTTVADGVLDVANFNASAIVTEAEGIENNDNDTTLPTSAAVKDYVDTVAGDVSGSGTTNNLTKWSSASTITDSLFTDDGSTISLSTSGGSNTLNLSHISGSGIALNITKGGDGEALLVNKTSGSGNAVSVTGDSYFNGSVGIGTDIPVADLHINNTSGNSSIRLSGGAVNNETYEIEQGITAVGNGGLGFYNVTEGEYTMVFQDSTRNVGIGLTDPTAKLHILKSEDSSDDIFKIEHTFYSVIGVPLGNVSTFTINSTGDVGINTDSPAYKLDVNGSLHSSNITIADYIIHEGDTNTYAGFGGSDYFRVVTGGVDRLQITNSTTSIATPLGVSGVITATGGNSTEWNTAYDYSQIGHIPNSEKGVVNGVATLDGNGKVPLTQINDSILGQVEYKGLWNASTNTPTLPATPTEKGHYYIVSAVGTQFGESYEVGDWIISDGSSWGKVDNTDAVSSVFGRTGNVSADESDYASFYPRLSQSYANPTWISSIDWNKLINKPTYAGDDFSIDTGPLTGATVISDLDINVTTDTDGNVTDANGAVSTRTLTLGDFGYIGPLNPEVNQNAFSNVAVSGQTTVAADSKTDTLTLVAGSNVTLTTNATNDSITISSTDTNTNTNYYLTGLSYTSSTSLLTATVSGASNPTLDLTDKIYADALAVSGNGTTAQYLRSDGDGTFTWATPPNTNTTNFNIQANGGTQVNISAGEEINFINGGATTVAVTNQTNPTVQFNHANTSSQASVNNSGRTYVQDITLDTYGHITSITSATETVVDTGVPAILSNGSTPSLNSGITAAEIRTLIGAGTSSSDTTNFNIQANGGTQVNISAGEEINFINGTAINAVVTNQTNPTVRFNHGDTSSQGSVNNSSGTVIQDVTLDAFGHVTALGSVNLDSRYYTESEADSRFVNVTGDTMTGTLTATNFILSSDRNLKKNIKPLNIPAIDVEWKSYELKEGDEGVRYGVIAQELEETNPELVNTNEEGVKSVKYIDLLIAKIAELEARLEKAGL